jgi:hypothetical protein
MWLKIIKLIMSNTRGQNYIRNWKAIYDVKTKFQAGHELMDECLYPGSKEDSWMSSYYKCISSTRLMFPIALKHMTMCDVVQITYVRWCYNLEYSLYLNLEVKWKNGRKFKDCINKTVKQHRSWAIIHEVKTTYEAGKLYTTSKLNSKRVMN